MRAAQEEHVTGEVGPESAWYFCLFLRGKVGLGYRDPQPTKRGPSCGSKLARGLRVCPFARPFPLGESVREAADVQGRGASSSRELGPHHGAGRPGV